MDTSGLGGWIGLAGLYDFMPIENKTARPVFHFPNTPPQSQPINHTGGAVLPALLIAVSTDKLVNPVRNTGRLAARLRAGGVPAEELHCRTAAFADADPGRRRRFRQSQIDSAALSQVQAR